MRLTPRTLLLLVLAAQFLAVAGSAEPPPAPTVVAAPTARALAVQDHPLVPKRLDIAAYDIWLDKDTCALWVTFKNTGTVKIETTLRFQVFVDGVKVEDKAMGVNRAPGEYFSHQVGTTANPYKVGIKAKEVEFFIDSTNVLKEADETNNRLKKSVSCAKMFTQLPKPKP